ncbi:MAG: biotin--[acetyl-CoA-carboxylase] ligase [Marinifilaceae bacterium]
MERRDYSIHNYQVKHFDTLTSTNGYISALPLSEVGDKSVVLTYNQTAGRGQVGNKWESEAGKNVSFTIAYRPDIAPSNQFVISMCVALGCRRFVARYSDGCCVKWPNDIYVGDEKIAGILIEHTVMGNRLALSIAGIGMNINQKVFVSDAPNPVSLQMLIGHELVLDTVMEQLLEDIDVYYSRRANVADIHKEYMQALYRRDGYYGWRDEAGEFIARITDVDCYGRLVLETEQGEQRIYGFKEVSYLLR